MGFFKGFMSRTGARSALLAVSLLVAAPAWAQTAIGTVSPTTPKTLLPGESYDVTVTVAMTDLNPGPVMTVFLTYSLTDLVNSSQFAITNNCPGSMIFSSNSTQSCTVNVKYLGTDPAPASATLNMGCNFTTGGMGMGGFGFSCLVNAPLTLGVIGRVAGGVAQATQVAVNTLGPGGLTLLALALFGVASGFSLRRR